MKKSVIIVALVVIVAGAIAYFYVNNNAKAPTNEANQTQNPSPDPSPSGTTTPPNTQTNVKGNNGADYTPPKTPSGGEVPAADIQVTEIDYDGSQFTPETVSIKAGDYVFFKNKSSSDFWPASNPHPTHTDYPGFDALKAIPAGGEYKFQFKNIGTWGFHDHLNPVAHGKVIVAK